MRHAFLIIAHNNWSQLAKFLETIDSSKCDFYIHINSKIQFSNKDKKTLTDVCRKSKVFLSERVPITWGDFGICAASLIMLEMARNTGGGTATITFLPEVICFLLISILLISFLKVIFIIIRVLI